MVIFHSYVNVYQRVFSNPKESISTYHALSTSQRALQDVPVARQRILSAAAAAAAGEGAAAGKSTGRRGEDLTDPWRIWWVYNGKTHLEMGISMDR